ncbi:MAG: thioredoxin domain-containing protein [Candidatus Marinimicrobia bacterium]|nr:thioredoxin domain-containing protein [Candidatus Neomarinimicrobiota bacterium]
MTTIQVRDKAHQNRLGREQSPYLLQHADNPVDWYPWGEEAFEAARRENKPIFLSIGYSTCHWCHVMEHESFEDPEVARLMNEGFISIKVDREERPDIDNIYMTVCQMMTGSGGWPLTIVMTPDKRPFFAATYIPKESRYGRTGMVDLLPRLRETWLNEPDRIEEAAQAVVAALNRSQESTGGNDLDQAVLSMALKQARNRFDARYGGFGSQPKFPSPHQLLFLLRSWHRSQDPATLEMVEKTLTAMRQGGIYDHVGFGFHRYSTDEKWLVPHFEKMLYDQAMLALAYTAAYQATGKAAYARTVDEIFTYVLRDMTSSEGGFYSAEDADSEGEEGKFYLWTHDEIRQILSSDDTEFVMASLNVARGGNFRDGVTGKNEGSNILHLTAPLGEPDQQRWDLLREQLFTVREKRVHPGKDDKILTDWNGLMIAALARAGQALDRPDYIAAAEKAVTFILGTLRDDRGRLLHRYRNGQAGITGHLDDYAFIVWGLLELYEATFKTDYLETALALNAIMLDQFWDDEGGGFFFTADDGEALLVRHKDIYDGAIPSGNSVAAMNLLRLGRMTVNPALEERAAALGRAFSSLVNRSPTGFAQLLSAVDFGVGPAYEVVIAGKPGSADTENMLAALRRAYHPNIVVIFHPIKEHGEADIIRLAPFIKTQVSLDGQATAYVCRNYACQRPTTDTAVMLAALSGK